MFITVNGLKIRYDRREGGRPAVLILHGWGASAAVMDGIFRHFTALGRETVALDFPGFGGSPPPPADFTIYDYAEITAAFIEELGLGRPDVIAHSFGGRVGIILAARERVNRLLLTGPAGVRPRRGIRYRLRVAGYKLRKKLGKSTDGCGSADYRALSGDMRRVFVSVVNTPLDGLLGAISCPTLIIVGGRDRETPPYMARRICSRAALCRVVELKNSGHFAFLDEPTEFLLIAERFLGEEP